MRTLARLIAAVVLAAGLAGSSAVPAVAQDQAQVITVPVTLTSQQTILEQVGRGGDITYGWNQLTGSVSMPSGDVDVQLLGNVQYVDGSGRFFGSLTLKFASLSTLGLDVNGTAKLRKDGSTALKAKLRVIGGNAAMTGAKGGGSFTGERAAALGSPIVIDIELRLRGIS